MQYCFFKPWLIYSSSNPATVELFLPDGLFPIIACEFAQVNSSASQGLGALGTIDRHIPAWRCQVIINAISFLPLVAEMFPFASAVITETIAGSLPGIWTSRFPQTDMPLMLFPAQPSSWVPVSWFMGSAHVGRGLQVSDLTTLDSSPWLTRGQAWVLCCSVNLTFWVCMMWTALFQWSPACLFCLFSHETLAFLQFFASLFSLLSSMWCFSRKFALS